MKRNLFKTLSGRFMLIISTLIFFLGISICTFCFWLFQRNLTTTMLQETETNLQFLSQKINFDINNILSFSTQSCNNPDIIRFLMTTKENGQYNSVTAKAVEFYNNEFDSNNSRQYIQRSIVGSFIKDDYLQQVYSMHSVDRPMSVLVKRLPYFYSYINNKPVDEYLFELHESEFPCSTKQMIPFIQKIEYPYNTNELGYIYNEISVSVFTDAINAYMNPGIKTVFITIGTKTYTLDPDSPNTLIPAERLDIEHAEASDSFSLTDTTLSVIHKNNSNSRVVTRPLSMNACYISAEISPTAFQKMLHKYILITIAIIAVIILSGIITISLSFRLLMKPIRKIYKHIKDISNGDFAPDPSIEWNNEIGDTGRLINSLGENIDELLKNRLRDECEKKDYEYKMLQSQINPHFIYNTLNSIKWMAIVQHADGISEMTTSLSRLLKNISKGRNTLVSIEDELNLLNEYFIIEKYRYGGAIELKYQIDEPEIKHNKILRFTLQPIVENAIFHGIEPKGSAGTITIKIFYNKDKETQIDITDDGIGMTPENIEKILNEDSNDGSTFFKGMGIASVNKMLQYTFGAEYGIAINSEPGIYTTVTVLLPKADIERRLSQDEITDR